MIQVDSTGLSSHTSILDVSETQFRLSRVEWISAAYFAGITLAACVLQLGVRGIGIIAALSVLTVATLAALQRNRERAPWLAAAADLFPALLLLVAYRESGLLLAPDSTHWLDLVFIRWDRALLQNHLTQAALRATAPWLQHYLEFAYLLCYPLVPLGVGAIHLGARLRKGSESSTRLEAAMHDFWAAVLPAALFCYAVYPFFPLTPPRVLFGDVPGPHIEPLLRRLNFWLLDRYSVQACIFPSGHVAAATAVALAVRKHAPRLGTLFLFLAASVAIATIYGRYHYAADALAGALVGVTAFYVSKLLS
jgi:membrane-associated phospholipid phosphatase